MKNRKTLLFALMITVFSIGFIQAQKKSKDFPVLKGPYLGQKTPGMIPEIFAPEVITKAPHSVAVFSPDG